MIDREVPPENQPVPGLLEPLGGSLPGQLAAGGQELPASCRSCRFWRQAGRGGPGPDWGLCKRMPPVLPEIDEDKMVHVGIWPSTEAKDWCGEWQLAPPFSG